MYEDPCRLWLVIFPLAKVLGLDFASIPSTPSRRSLAPFGRNVHDAQPNRLAASLSGHEIQETSKMVDDLRTHRKATFSPSRPSCGTSGWATLQGTVANVVPPTHRR